MPDVALLIDWENVYYTMRQHTEGPLPSTLSILQAILTKTAEFGPVRVKLAIFGQEVAAQDETLLMALEFTGIEPIAVAQRMSGRLLKGRSDAVLITRAMKLLYKERPDLDTWFIVSGDRDLNALCKALKDEDKHVYLVAGDQSLANELRESPYLRDDVFLLEELIPQARWTRTGTGLRTDDTQADRAERGMARPGTAERGDGRARRGGRGRGGRGRAAAVPRPEPTVPAVVPTGEPESEKEQRRLAVLLLDQLVALRAPAMKRADFVSSVVPLSEKEASTVLEKRLDAAIEQGHIVAKASGRSRAKANLLIKPQMTSPLVAETFFHLVRVLRRIDNVTADARRVPAVEAVLDPLSRADQPGGIARGRTQRRVLLETLFNIAELARRRPPARRLRTAGGVAGRAPLQLRALDAREGRPERLGERGALRGAPRAGGRRPHRRDPAGRDRAPPHARRGARQARRLRARARPRGSEVGPRRVRAAERRGRPRAARDAGARGRADISRADARRTDVGRADHGRADHGRAGHGRGSRRCGRDGPHGPEASAARIARRSWETRRSRPPPEGGELGSARPRGETLARDRIELFARRG